MCQSVNWLLNLLFFFFFYIHQVLFNYVYGCSPLICLCIIYMPEDQGNHYSTLSSMLGFWLRVSVYSPGWPSLNLRSFFLDLLHVGIVKYVPYVRLQDAQPRIGLWYVFHNGGRGNAHLGTQVGIKCSALTSPPSLSPRGVASPTSLSPRGVASRIKNWKQLY